MNSEHQSDGELSRDTIRKTMLQMASVLMSAANQMDDSKKVRELENNNRKLEDDLKKVRSELSSKKHMYDDVVKNLQSARRIIKSMQESNSKIIKENETLRQQLDSLKAKIRDIAGLELEQTSQKPINNEK